MKAFRALRLLIFSPALSSSSSRLHLNPLSRSYSSAYPEKASASSEDDAVLDFDSREFSLPFSSSTGTAVHSSSVGKTRKHQLWDDKFRAKADQILFGEEKPSRSQGEDEQDEDEDKEKAKMLAKALLEAALLPPDDVDDENMIVKEEDQKSLSVGIVGAPNAGKSSLTNSMVCIANCA